MQNAIYTVFKNKYMPSLTKYTSDKKNQKKREEGGGGGEEKKQQLNIRLNYMAVSYHLHHKI